ncbi:hypothetical protein ACPT9H_18200 [Brevibacillus borstelensis]|uniref:hypothetical protein n=1 Tax=Brevibacillus borstelensis TaxID=45462 RepID=UPI003CE4C4BD
MSNVLTSLDPMDVRSRIMGAIFVVFKKPEAIAQFVDESTGTTYVVTYNRKILKISVGNGDYQQFDNLLVFLTSQIGPPDKIYTKESRLDPGQMISYMEWLNK